MMNIVLPVLVTLVLGISTVMQSGLNRKMGQVWSLPAAVFFNACVFFVLAAAVLFLDSLRPASSSTDWRAFSLWYVLPGTFGFLFVLGAPWVVARIGAAQTFVLIVAAQLLASLLWDWQVEAIIPKTQRMLGVGLAVVGAIFASLK